MAFRLASNLLLYSSSMCNTSNSQSSCLSWLTTETTGMCHNNCNSIALNKDLYILFIYINIYIFIYILCLHACMCTRRPEEGVGMPWNWSYRRCGLPCGGGNWTRSSVRAVSMFNFCATFQYQHSTALNVKSCLSNPQPINVSIQFTQGLGIITWLFKMIILSKEM